MLITNKVQQLFNTSNQTLCTGQLQH